MKIELDPFLIVRIELAPPHDVCLRVLYGRDNLADAIQAAKNEGDSGNAGALKAFVVVNEPRKVRFIEIG